MAFNLKTSIAARNAELNALGTAADNGYIRIYDGAQPATPETAVTTQNLLAELRFGSPAFGSAAGGIISANSITGEDDILLDGTAAWFRVLASDGTTALYDGAVDVSGADMNFTTVSFVQHAAVDLTTHTYTLPE